MLKLVILDVDGILTDGKKYYDKTGLALLKTFCDKDWTAIKRMRALGLEVMFLTGDPFNVALAQNRKIDVIVNRQDGKHTDKGDYLPEICEKYGVQPNEICFVGDDVFDIGMMRLVGYKFCPSDSPRIVKRYAAEIDCPGGQNFVMQLLDKLISLGLITEQSFEEHIAKVYELDLKEKF